MPRGKGELPLTSKKVDHLTNPRESWGGDAFVHSTNMLVSCLNRFDAITAKARSASVPVRVTLNITK